jgi:hypothetical protein
MQLASHYSKSQLKLSFASCSILPMHKLQGTMRKLEVTHLYTGREQTSTQNVLLDKEHTSVKHQSTLSAIAIHNTHNAKYELHN